MTQRGHCYAEMLSCSCKVKGKGVSLLQGSVTHRIHPKIAAVSVFYGYIYCILHLLYSYLWKLGSIHSDTACLIVI